MTTDRLDNREFKLETGISYLLIAGVIASLVLEITGITILYFSYGQLAISQDARMFIQGHDFFTFTYQTFRGKFTGGSALLLITAGIIVLILTPYLRVVASVIYFIWEKNIKYILITLFVLVVVTLSLALH